MTDYYTADSVCYDVTLPTHSAKAEQAILVGVLQQPDLFPEVVEMLKPEHFYNTPHQVIFEAMLQCFRLGEELHVVTISEMLKDSGNLEVAGGYSYFYELCEMGVDGFLPTPQSIRYWARVVATYAGKRMLSDLFAECAAEPNFNLSEVRERMQEASLLLDARPVVGTGTALEDARQAIEDKLLNSTITGLTTGFRRLDAMINGLEPNRLITVAARSGNGKTAFALNVTAHLVLNEKRPVLFYSLEMTAKELMERLIRIVAGTVYDRAELRKATDLLIAHQNLLLVEDNADRSINDITAHTFKAHKQHPDLGLVIVDYIGKVKPDAASKRYNSKAYEVEGVTWGLKQIAKTQSLPVMGLCQMNRGIEARGDKKPMLSDLKDSGGVEQDSDIVIFLVAEGDEKQTPTLTVAKNRNGAAGDIKMFFNGPNLRFSEAPKVVY